MKRILVVDDHALFRDGIVSLLNASGFEVVAQVGEGSAAIQAAAELDLDLVLLDLSLPDIKGLEVLQQILAIKPHLKVVMLTASSSNEDIMEAVKSGAHGYLIKNMSSEKFIESIHALERGEVALSSQLFSKIVSKLNQQDLQETGQDQKGPPLLTYREKEILVMIAKGMTNKHIAEQVGISENTVKYHLKNIFLKLGVNNRAEAVTKAIQANLIEI